MANAILLAKIEAAKKAVSDADDELRHGIGDIALAPRAEKVEVDELVRAASSKLKAAKAKLVDLEAELIDLEEPAPLAKLDAARTAVGEAEERLDGVLGEMVVAEGSHTTWMGKAVKDAFAKLRIAKTALEDLESIATDEG